MHGTKGISNGKRGHFLLVDFGKKEGSGVLRREPTLLCRRKPLLGCVYAKIVACVPINMACVHVVHFLVKEMAQEAC